MALDHLIPELWGRSVLESLNNRLVFAQITDRSYDAQVSGAGDVIHLNEVANVSVSAYTKNSTSTSASALVSASKRLEIDQAYSFDFYIEDIDAKQQTPKVLDYARGQAVYQLQNTADQYLAGLYTEAGLAVGSTGSPIQIDSTNVVEQFLTAHEKLMEANADTDRGMPFIVIEPWLATKLSLAGVVSASDTVSSQVWKNGQKMGNILGFDVYISNNLSKTSSKTNVKCIFGISNMSFAFVQQILSVETMRHDTKFADRVRGLHLYGGKCQYPNATGVLFATYAAEA